MESEHHSGSDAFLTSDIETDVGQAEWQASDRHTAMHDPTGLLETRDDERSIETLRLANTLLTGEPRVLEDI